MVNDPGENDNTNKGKDSRTRWGCVLSAFLLLAAVLAFIIPNFLRARSVGRFSHCQENCRLIGGSLEMYAKRHDGKYPSTLTALTPDYLRTIPACSSSETNRGYIDSYQVSSDFRNYTFYCSGENHKDFGLPKDFPLYDSFDGLKLQD